MLLTVLNFRQLPGQLQRIVIPPVPSLAPFPRLSDLFQKIPSSMQTMMSKWDSSIPIEASPQAVFSSSIDPYDFLPIFWLPHKASMTIHQPQLAPCLEFLFPGMPIGHIWNRLDRISSASQASNLQEAL